MSWVRLFHSFANKFPTRLMQRNTFNFLFGILIKSKLRFNYLEIENIV